MIDYNFINDWQTTICAFEGKGGGGERILHGVIYLLDLLQLENGLIWTLLTAVAFTSLQDSNEGRS